MGMSSLIGSVIREPSPPAQAKAETVPLAAHIAFSRSWSKVIFFLDALDIVNCVGFSAMPRWDCKNVVLNLLFLVESFCEAEMF